MLKSGFIAHVQYINVNIILFSLVQTAAFRAPQSVGR